MASIFMEILNRSIAAGWMILAVIALRGLLRKAPKWMICLLWALVAVRLVCPFSMESVFSMIPSRETMHGEAIDRDGNYVDSGVRLLDDALNPMIRQSLDSAAIPDAERKPHADAGAGTGAEANLMQRILFCAGIVWMAGIAGVWLYSVICYIRLRLKVRTAVRLQESVYVSEFVDTPFILGVLRPRIYLPAGLPEEVRPLVLSHEYAHLARRDNLWKVLGYALLCVYWFQPLCWVAYALFCRDMELACDESVIKSYDTHHRRMYSEALLACSLGRGSAFSQSLTFGELGVKERIKAVLRYRKPAVWAAAAAVAVCIVIAVCFLTDPVSPGSDSGNVLAGEQGGESGKGDGQPGADGSGSNNGQTGGDGNGPDNGQPGKDGNGPDSTQTGEKESAADNIDDQGEQGGSGADGSEGTADILLRETFVNDWANAFVSRDGDAIRGLSSEEVVTDFGKRDMLSGSEGRKNFGISSPWPEEVQRDVRICEINPEDAVINYYAWTSEPHVTVWKEKISYRRQDGHYVVTKEELTWLDDISSLEEYSEAYGYFEIDGTAMDYETNGLGETLNNKAQLSSSTIYWDYLQPESALVRLLNLSEDSVSLERVYEEPGQVNFFVRFPREENDLSMPVTMIQPYGPEGIWIPKNRRIDLMARLRRTDWEEIRSRHMTLPNDPVLWYHDIVLIAELPEENIRLYGYNDAEWSGEGVAIDMGGDISYFDWIYTTPRAILPTCYWNSGKKQLQVALKIYTGTGVAAEALHVLQYDDDNVPQDHVLELNELWDMLDERIGFSMEEETGRLRLFDKENQEELALVDIGEDEAEITGLELGNISSYYLGETIRLLVEPGYFSDGASIAEYPEGMPALEVEVVLVERNGEIRFELGEIMGVFE